MHQASQLSARILVGNLHRCGGQERLFPLGNVAPYLLPERILCTVTVENIVTYLECHAQFRSEGVYSVAVLLRGPAANRTYDGGTGEQDGRLERYHVQVILHGNPFERFEIHVVLLSLAHLQRGIVEDAENTGQDGRVGLFEQTVGVNHHGIARKDGAVDTPFAVYGRFAAADGSIVHDVVVQQREVVENLHRRSTRQRTRHVVAEYVACHHGQQRPEPFAALTERIDNGLVKRIRLFGKGKCMDVLLYDG